MNFVNVYRRWLSRMAMSHFSRFWLGPKVISRADRLLYKPTHGGLLSLGSRAYPTLLLTTTGRKTGHPHTVPLFYLPSDQGLLVVASNYGRPQHPGWSANLVSQPVARVQVDHRSWEVRARLLAPEDKAAVWPELLDLFDGWQQYEEETERSIRVFSLDPI